MCNKSSLYDLLSKTDLSPLEKFDIYRNYIILKTIKNRELYSVKLELTPVCNFNCEICYIRRTLEEVHAKGKHVMNFEEWKYYIDGFCDIGVNSFTLTGGECTLHPDFLKIYQYIYNKGKIISLITNGSALTNEIINIFKEMPPKKVFITLYGMSEETYEKFCQNKSAYNKVKNNINKLLMANIKPTINFTCGKDNIDDMIPVFKYGTELGLDVIPSWSLVSYDLCDADKIFNYQISEERFNNEIKTAFGYTISDTKCNDTQDTNLVFTEILSDSELVHNGIPCNAARNTCTINWEGKMFPCVAFDAFSIDPHDVGGVKECWKQIVKWADEVPQMVECQQCIFRNRCHQCIARHYNDTHEFGKPSPRLCFKIQHPEEAAKLQAEYDRRQAEKAKSAETTETTDKTETTPDQGVVS